MTRAVNMNMDMDAAISLCGRLDIHISAIEPLDSGGTRVVLKSSEGAAKLSRSAKAHVIEGPVVRSRLYQARPSISYD
ncbi:MAG: hypothetical protein EP321_01320 [Sphingomonadales bacterium]|nr:MAG: hypothetical protein EP345_06975 [Sphingomonadales bacterium]TNF06018.1 MAG: hypothetical protein EP321_01320 [Sphingomonadales bacterium]